MRSIHFFAASLALLGLFVLGVSLAHAQDADSTPPASEVADLIQERYEKTGTFEADFVQRLTRAAIGVTTETRGKLWFKRPSLVRWETREPEEAREIIVVGEDVVWDYLEDLNTVDKMRVPDLLNSRTLMRFLTGQANLKDDFRVEAEWSGRPKLEEHWKESGLMLFRLVPHEPEPGMMLAYIGVEPETFFLRKIMTVDFQGNGNELHLNNLDVDVDVDMMLFLFEPPEGVLVNDLTAQE